MPAQERSSGLGGSSERSARLPRCGRRSGPAGPPRGLTPASPHAPPRAPGPSARPLLQGVLHHQGQVGHQHQGRRELAEPGAERVHPHPLRRHHGGLHQGRGPGRRRALPGGQGHVGERERDRDTERERRTRTHTHILRDTHSDTHTHTHRHAHTERHTHTCPHAERRLVQARGPPFCCRLVADLRTATDSGLSRAAARSQK